MEDLFKVFPSSQSTEVTPISLPEGMKEESLIGMPLESVKKLIIQYNPTFTVETDFEGGRYMIENSSNFVRIIYGDEEKVKRLSRSQN